MRDGFSTIAASWKRCGAACGASIGRIPALKQLILQASREAANCAGLEGKAGLLCDAFGQDALNAITEGRVVDWSSHRAAGLPAAGDRHGNIGTQLITLAAGARGEMSGLFPSGRYPEPCALSRRQKIAEVYHACCQSGHELRCWR